MEDLWPVGWPMTADWIVPLVTGIGGGGVGAGIRPILDYLKTKRGQTDEVAMGLVDKLQARVEQLERAQASERELCDTKLAVLRADLMNVQGNFDSLLLAIEIAPEKAAEVVAKIKDRRDRRITDSIAATQEERGEIRQTAQIRMSARRVT